VVTLTIGDAGMTGIEALVGPAIAKAAGAGAARAGGWSGRKFLQHRQASKIEALLGIPAVLIREYDDSTELSSLLAFCGSPEIEHIAASLGQAYLVSRSDKKVKNFLGRLKMSFIIQLPHGSIGSRPLPLFGYFSAH
jgi:hypothetical protein